MCNPCTIINVDDNKFGELGVGGLIALVVGLALVVAITTLVLCKLLRAKGPAHIPFHELGLNAR